MNLKKIKFRKVTLVHKPNGGELPALENCNFCGKQIDTNSPYQNINRKLAGESSFCAFCLRNNFNTANNRNVLIVSFSNIVEYFYNQLYSKEKKIWMSQIEDYVKVHETVGLQNPLFSYDPESLYWFVDFTKVGITRKKVDVNAVLKSVILILASFNLAENISYLNLSNLFFGYKNGIMDFYLERKRPKRRILIPSLDVYPQYFNKNATNFSWKDLKSIDTEPAIS